MQTLPCQSADSTDTLRAQYRADGFRIVRKLFDADEIAGLGAQLNRAARGELSPEIAIQVEPELAGSAERDPLLRVRKVAGLARNDPYFKAFVGQTKITRLVTAILGDDIRYLGDEAQLKPPRNGSAHPWHQDAPYFHREPMSFATIWISIDAASRANGCLEVLPGRHLTLLPRRSNSKAWVEDGEWDTSASLAVELSPGDALIFHALLPHGSGPNRTDLQRRSLIARYVNVAGISPEHAKIVQRHGALSSDPSQVEIFRNIGTH
jgi:ectoine hydroxylase-related dioxygenase (phytanoyl-CoA dioxygenase family)